MGITPPFLFHRLVEEADYRSTTELFAKADDEKTLDNFIPKSESDFLEYAELIAHKLCPYEVYQICFACIYIFIWWFVDLTIMIWLLLLLQKSYFYIGLLKDVMRLSMSSLKGADAKEIASSVTAIANEKIKAEKEANASKKKGEFESEYIISIAQVMINEVDIL